MSILCSMVGASFSSAPLPTWQLFSTSASETQPNGIFDGQIAIMGYNTNGTIRAAYAGNNNSSTQGFLKPILFDPSGNTFTIGTKVNSMGYTSSVIFGLKAVSETEFNIGTADATNFGVTYLPNNNSPGNLVSIYPFSMNSSGTISVGTHVVLPFSNVGTADRASDIAFDGTYGGVPRYTFFTRFDTGTAGQIALSRSSNTLSIARQFNGHQCGNRATIAASFAGLNDASALMNDGNSGTLFATTWGSTTRQTATPISFGIQGKADIVLISGGTTAKYMVYGNATGGGTQTSRIVNVTYSASAVPTISLGASLYQEHTTTRFPEYSRLVKSWNANEAFLFYTDSNQLYVKTASVSGDVITWSSATLIDSLSASYFDIMPYYVSSSNKGFIGVGWDGGNVNAFAVKNNA